MSNSIFYDLTPFNYGFSSKEKIVANMNKYLRLLIEQNKGKIFCDIGCGCGRNLLYASNFAKILIGVDLSTQSLAFAREFVNSNQLELILGNNLDIPINSEFADIVISDGVCHHTGDTFKAFTECVRILKKGGKLYLAVYKKFRYYPFLYLFVGGFLRILNKKKLGNYLIENFFVKIHFSLYILFKKEKLSITETRNIFYDYFLTPIATFQSKNDVKYWCYTNNCSIIQYDRTSGNYHVFVIKKHE
jgi:ubiquinone/menaquinone biosynthesis C-methylase UbiE